MMMMVMNVVEEVKQKLRQLWQIVIKWSFPDFIRWVFSRLQYLGRLLDMKLTPSVASTRRFITKRLSRVPNPSPLWSPALRSKEPLPTNAAWLNFVLNDGSMPEYIHPYLISCKQGALSICYWPPKDGPQNIEQAFTADITIAIASPDDAQIRKQHMVTSFDDLSVTLQLHGGIQVPLVRGCPYVTFIFNTARTPTFGIAHKARKLQYDETRKKHKLLLENGQTWIIYSSNKLLLQLVEPAGMLKVEEAYRGLLRVSVLNGAADAEAVLDEHAATYPVGGRADLSVPFQVKYTWEKEGLKQKSILMLSLPIHRDMMARDDHMDPGMVGACMHPSVTYDGIDGKMEAIASDSWVFKTQTISNERQWHSIGGIQDAKNKRELQAVLRQDMSELIPLPENVVSAYSHGKFLARVAQLAMIAEELGSCLDILKQARDLLSSFLTPWIEGTFRHNAFIYDSKWGGIIPDRKRGWLSHTADGAYDDAHYTLGNFCYAGAVLAKLDRAWGEAHKAHLYTLLKDYMSAERGFRQKNKLELSDTRVFPRLRYFDLWVLHSWGGDGLTESKHGRRQVSSSEAVHAYYAGAMLGSAFGDQNLQNLGLTLASLEIKAAQLLWHIPSSSSVYPSDFRSHNRMVGVLWATKRESLGPPSTDTTYAKPTVAAYVPITQLGPVPTMESEMPGGALTLQVLPLIPISQFLFSSPTFAKELVDWASPFLSISHVAGTWKSCVYALESLYEQPSSVAKKALALSYPNQEGSVSILLWWVFSRKVQ